MTFLHLRVSFLRGNGVAEVHGCVPVCVAFSSPPSPTRAKGDEMPPSPGSAASATQIIRVVQRSCPPDLTV